MCEQLQDDINVKERDDDETGNDDVAISSSICQAVTYSVHLLHANDHESDVDHGRNADHSDRDVLDIFAGGVTAPKYEGTKFVGSCIDLGAQYTVIGVPQATPYCGIAVIDLKKLPCRTPKFKFGDAVHGGLGQRKWDFHSQMIITSLYAHTNST